jgi:hypothetical protein
MEDLVRVAALQAGDSLTPSSIESSFWINEVQVCEHLLRFYCMLVCLHMKGKDSFNYYIFTGRSKPNGCLENNTTWDLVGDIEQVSKSPCNDLLNSFIQIGVSAASEASRD